MWCAAPGRIPGLNDISQSAGDPPASMKRMTDTPVGYRGVVADQLTMTTCSDQMSFQACGA